ncbi:MAG: terminase large subunit domain-containing protein [Candidatus Dormibacteria bacterium]
MFDITSTLPKFPARHGPTGQFLPGPKKVKAPITSAIFDTTDTAFQNNVLLKKIGIEFALTTEQIVEYNKCANDVVYFIENYVMFMTLDHGLTKVKLWDFQKDILQTYVNERQTIVKTCRQVGKALSIDTPIPTPSGWTTMGKLKVGDMVFGSDGKPTQVVFATSVMYDHPCYKVTFDSGYEIVADADHMWEANVPGSKSTTWTTGELCEQLPKAKKSSGGISIKNQQPVDYGARSQLPIDPYILGLWLGGGTNSGGDITCGDYDWPHYSNHLKKIGYELTPRGFKMEKHPFPHHTGNFCVAALTTKLMALGVRDNKHIPTCYKYASIWDRQELIRGLMDSDGTVGIRTCKSGNKRVVCSFSQNIGRLMGDVREVFASLGVKTWYHESGIYANLTCTTNRFDLFNLPRKRERLALIQGNYQLQNHYIKSIEAVQSVPVCCIQVDAPNQLYLCGEGFIPTHNTSTTVGFILHYILFNTDKTVAVLAQKEKTATEILTRIKEAYQNIPLWMQQGIAAWNQTSIVVENGSRIFSESTATGAIRGFSINILYLDEFAHVPSHVAEEFVTSVYPTISSGETSKMIMTSTPYGLNLFYKFWQDAIKEKTDPNNWNGFKAIAVHWSQVPGRSQQWADQQRKVLGEHKYTQDIEAEFLGSSNTLITGIKLRQLAFVPPLEYALDKSLAIYKKTEPGHTYALVADPSEGKGLDYSAFTVFDITQAPYTIAARYRNNTVDDLVFASYIQQSALHYNSAYVTVENNNIGALVLHHITRDLDYDNCFYSIPDSDKEPTATQGRGTPGIKTSDKVKTQGCARLKTLVENDQIILQDFDMISELSTFVLGKNKRFAAEVGYYDDTTTTLWLFAWLTQQPFFRDISDIHLREKLFADREQTLADVLLPPPIITDTNFKPKPHLEVQGGVVWIDSDLGYEEALNILNGKDY